MEKNKKEMVKFFIKEILSSKYIYGYNSLGVILEIFHKTKIFNQKYGTNFWLEKEKIGESNSYRIKKITAGKNGVILVGFPNGKKIYFEKNFLFLKMKEKREEKFFFPNKKKKNIEEYNAWDKEYYVDFLQICAGDPNIWKNTYGTLCPYSENIQTLK